MRVAYLLDTDWASLYIRGDSRIVTRLTELAPQGLAISIITLAELYGGAYYSLAPQKYLRGIEQLLKELVLLGLTDDICKRYGEEYARLRRQGQLFGSNDLFIGATAIQHDLTLLTENRQHFERIQGIKLMSLA